MPAPARTLASLAHALGAAADAVFLAGERVAVLLGQKLVGRKKWELDR